MRSSSYSLLLTFFLLSAKSLVAAPFSYEFCVSSSKIETFRALVVFRSLDFGELAARELLANQLRPHLSGFVIENFDSSCSCYAHCPLLEVVTGSSDKAANDQQSFIGGAAENLDSWFYEAKQIVANPGGTLKKAIIGIRNWLDD